MRCLFSTGGYYDLMYTDKIVKSVSKNPNKKKITTTYSVKWVRKTAQKKEQI